MTEPKSRLVYVRSPRAWYWRGGADRDDRYYDEIWVTNQALTDDGEDDGALWEFGIRWYHLGQTGDRLHWAMRIEIFDDALDALNLHSLWESLQLVKREDWEVLPEQVEAILDGLGFVDVTVTKDPYAESSQPPRTVRVVVEVAAPDLMSAEKRVLEHLSTLSGYRSAEAEF